MKMCEHANWIACLHRSQITDVQVVLDGCDVYYIVYITTVHVYIHVPWYSNLRVLAHLVTA